MEERDGRSDWVTLEELADELRVPLKTVRKWRLDGTAPPGARFGKHIRMRRADVDAWIADRMDR